MRFGSLIEARWACEAVQVRIEGSFRWEKTIHSKRLLPASFACRRREHLVPLGHAENQGSCDETLDKEQCGVCGRLEFACAREALRSQSV